MKRVTQRWERSIRVTNELKVDVEAIEDTSLALDGGTILQLNDVLFVPSMRRNCIYVSCLDHKNIHYYFRNRKCIIKFNEIDIVLSLDKISFIYFLIVIMWMR